jgi:hypothetical protein
MWVWVWVCACVRVRVGVRVGVWVWVWVWVRVRFDAHQKETRPHLDAKCSASKHYQAAVVDSALVGDALQLFLRTRGKHTCGRQLGLKLASLLAVHFLELVQDTPRLVQLRRAALDPRTQLLIVRAQRALLGVQQLLEREWAA